MAAKMYKDGKFKMVRGMDAKAHLDDGWTFEPSIKTTPRRRPRVQVKEVEIKNVFTGPEDLIQEETNNGD